MGELKKNYEYKIILLFVYMFIYMLLLRLYLCLFQFI